MTTDGAGRFEASGLPLVDVRARSLDPSWTLLDAEPVAPGAGAVVWTATRQAAVRLLVVEEGTLQPVELARTNVRVELEHEDGSTSDHGQWVGRGAGEVSFGLRVDEFAPDRGRVKSATFYGRASRPGGGEVEWRTDPLLGAYGLVEHRVEVPAGAAPEDPPLAEVAVELDVRFDDGTPYDGDLYVTWSGEDGARDEGRLARLGGSVYRAFVPEATRTLRVALRNASGSLPPWTRTFPAGALKEGVPRLDVTLERGAVAVLTRPPGWTGVWRVHASFRPAGEVEWRGSWNYGTDEAELRLAALREAEWRFRLTQEKEPEGDPIVRTVVLQRGDERVVD